MKHFIRGLLMEASVSEKFEILCNQNVYQICFGADLTISIQHMKFCDLKQIKSLYAVSHGSKVVFTTRILKLSNI